MTLNGMKTTKASAGALFAQDYITDGTNTIYYTGNLHSVSFTSDKKINYTMKVTKLVS